MTDSPDFESRVLAFERAWRRRSGPPIAEYLPPDDAGGSCRLRLLMELVCLDLEYRWRAATQAHEAIQPRYLEDYVRQFPILGPIAELPPELIAEEYRVRRRWGDRPDHAAFLGRFHDRRDQLRERLQLIDRELRSEVDSITPAAGALRGGKRSVPLDNGQPGAGAVHGDNPACGNLSYHDYVLEHLIGAGRTAKVYRARRRSGGGPVAVKYLRKAFLHDAEALDRFLAEAETVAGLEHPNIVRVHGFGRTPIGGSFIVMDLVDGLDLARVIKAGAASAADAVRWTVQACQAIEHAHRCGLVHCDLKPGNILLDRDGRVNVADFGMARWLSDDSRADDRIEGTAPFMAPEQVSRYWGPISPRTDVYGLGAVLYSLLTGRAPYTGKTLADILAQVISGVAPAAPGEIRSGVPERLNSVCLRCLAKAPAERFATVGQFRLALLTCADTQLSLPAQPG